MTRLALTSLACFALAAPALATPLTVELEGVRSGRGTLHVSVQSRAQFMQDGRIAGSDVAAPSASSYHFTFDLPPGEYALSVWHDDNGNGAFDKDANFMPLDGWAMPNSERLRGEPTFDLVRTVVGNAPVSVTLAMIYGR
jgi:uncharacterized protein (DUF2141 family)